MHSEGKFDRGVLQRSPTLSRDRSAHPRIRCCARSSLSRRDDLLILPQNCSHKNALLEEDYRLVETA
jgi:hypothetical protein